MQSFKRAIALFSIVAVSAFVVGCGGPGAPVSSSSDPVMEAADAALAPEGGGEQEAAPTEGESSEAETAPSAEVTTEPAPEAEAAEASTPEADTPE